MIFYDMNALNLNLMNRTFLQFKQFREVETVIIDQY